MEAAWGFWRLTPNETSISIEEPQQLALDVVGKKWIFKLIQETLQFNSVAQSCPTLCDPMNCSTPDLPVHHQLLKFTQIHVHLVSDAFQLSYPLLSPSPPALNLSQHQSFPMSQFFAAGGQSIGASASASVFPMNMQSWFPLA